MKIPTLFQRRSAVGGLIECEFCGAWLANEDEWFYHMTCDDEDCACLTARDYEEAKRLWSARERRLSSSRAQKESQ